jgi:nitroreductase
MRPWRYLTIRDQGLVALGDVFAEAGLNNDADLAEVKIAKLKNMPQRGPLMIVAIANIQANEKVPPLEQRLAVGAGIQNILTAAYAMELGAIWRTGEMAYDPHVKHSLGLQDNEEIIGFIYIGHVNCKLKKPPELTTADFVEDWPAKDAVLG